MFTGLVQHLGSIQTIEETQGGRRLSVEVGKWSYQPDPGDSIAVDGCCLTVVGVEGTLHHFDVVHRTLEMTTLGGLEAGALGLRDARAASLLVDSSRPNPSS